MLRNLQKVARLPLIGCQHHVARTANYSSKVAPDSDSNAVSNFQLCYELSDEQKELQQVARKFSREVIIPQAAEFDRKYEFLHDVYKQCWELGLVNMLVPKHAGGLDLGYLNHVVTTGEVSYADCGAGMNIVATSLGTVAVNLGGVKDQQKKYLGRLTDEPLYAALAVTEPEAGSDVSNNKTKAEKVGDEYIMNGAKMFISNGGVANWFAVMARTSSDPKVKASKGYSMFVVEADWPGVILSEKLINLGLRTTDTRGITFEDVRIPKENMIGPEGAGFILAMETFDRTRPLSSSGAVGISARALDEAAKYSIERKTFGKPICEHQAVAHMLAEMQCRLWTGQTAVHQSAWMIDNGIKSSRMSSMGKFLSAEAAMHNALDAVQIFGGYGYNTEYPVEKLMRDAKIHSIFEGTSQIQKGIIAADIISRARHGQL